MWRAEMLTGFQGHPRPLLRMGPLEAHSSEMCVFLTGSGTYREEEMRAGRSVVCNDLHRTINGRSSQRCHWLHPHCWPQSISQAGGRWPARFWRLPEHRYSEAGWAGGNGGFPKDGDNPAPRIPSGPTTSSDVWERGDCRGSPGCREGLGPRASHPPLWVVLLPAGPEPFTGRAAPGLLPCYGYLTARLQGVLFLLFIYPPSVLCKG